MALSNIPPARRSSPGAATLLPQIIPRPDVQPVEPQGSKMGDLALSWQIGWEQMKGVPAFLKGTGAALLEKA